MTLQRWGYTSLLPSNTVDSEIFAWLLIRDFFDFWIIREVLNSRASICVVGHFRRWKLGMQIVVSQKL